MIQKAIFSAGLHDIIPDNGWWGWNVKREGLRLFFAAALVVLTCLVALVLHDVDARRMERAQQFEENMVSVSAVDSPAATPAPTAVQTPAPTETPVPGIDSPWYSERNDQLFQLIQRNQPQSLPDEIELQIRQMYIDPTKPMIALTFDDGPKPGITDKILDILEKHHARATFFVCGWRFNSPESWAIAQRAVALGCEIGNHSWAHEDLQELNYVALRRSVQNTNDKIIEITGYHPHFLRPPAGRNSWDVMRVARENDMAVVFWSQSGNVLEVDPEKIAQNVQKQIVDGKELQDRDIILLHDTKPLMVDAVELIVPQLLEKGFQLVTVWELLNCSERGFVPGELYDHG